MIVLQGARERVDVLQFSPDGRLLVAPCAAGVQVWNDLKSGGRPASLLDHSRISAVQFTPDSRKLVLGHVGAQAGVLVHDLVTNATTEVPLELPYLLEDSFGLSPDGRFLVVLQCDLSRNQPGRLFCRALSDLATSLWSIGTRYDFYLPYPPLFLVGSESFLSLECQDNSVWGGSPGLLALDRLCPRPWPTWAWRA
jgi:hypothetical protein